jgi:hypothetical protein
MTSEQIERIQSMAHLFMGPTARALISAVGTLLFGVVISLVAAAFLKRAAPSDPLAV